MKRSLILLMPIFLMLLASCDNNSQVTDGRSGQTGVLIKTTEVSYMDPHYYEERIVTGEKGQLVLILDEDKDFYHVQFAVIQVPTLSGYIEKDAVSFNDDDIQKAESGLVKNVYVYEMLEKKWTSKRKIFHRQS